MSSTTVVIDGCDSAILGYIEESGGPRVIYSYDLLIDHFVAQFREDAPDQDEVELAGMALEWISYNIERGLGYLGPLAPAILYPAGRDEIDERVDQED